MIMAALVPPPVLCGRQLIGAAVKHRLTRLLTGLGPFGLGYCETITFPCNHSSQSNRNLHFSQPSTVRAAGREGGGGLSMDDDHTMGDWYSVPGLRLRDHWFTVPLDYSSTASSQTISVFAREVVAAGKESDQSLSYLLFLQGGPGFESPRPTDCSGWLQKACDGHRVILLDQRGTGLSTPLTVSALAQITPAQRLVDFVKHFRADSIVNDAELIRMRLVPNGDPWAVLGQSYGGFCAVTYLSFAPQSLKFVLLTGGLPPLIAAECAADVVYRACFQQVLQQNEKYYKRFPQDVIKLREVVNYLAQCEGGGVLLPSGSILTPNMLQLLGLEGLGSSAGFERLHYLFERVWDPQLIPGKKKQISYFFMNSVENWIKFESNPLYALLHESIYCQEGSSRWSAHKIRNEFGDLFDPVKAAKEDRPVLLTGEMIFPCMFDEISGLRPFKEVAHMLAAKEDWPPLYDVTKLGKNQVPVAAAVYYDDMFVNFSLAMETASKIEGIRLWITNEYMHSGLRDGGGHVWDQLMALIKGQKPLF